MRIFMVHFMPTFMMTFMLESSSDMSAPKWRHSGTLLRGNIHLPVKLGRQCHIRRECKYTPDVQQLCTLYSTFV